MRYGIFAALVLAAALVTSCEDEVGMTSLPRGTDLQIDLLYLPDGVDDSEVFTVAWEVLNVGTEDSPATSVFIDVYDLDWNWHKGYSLSGVPALYPGEVLYDYAGMKIRNDVPVAGTFFVVVTVDPYDLVVELSEYNNHSAGIVKAW